MISGYFSYNHYVKSVRICRFFGSQFPASGLNTDHKNSKIRTLLTQWIWRSNAIINASKVYFICPIFMFWTHFLWKSDGRVDALFAEQSVLRLLALNFFPKTWHNRFLAGSWTMQNLKFWIDWTMEKHWETNFHLPSGEKINHQTS